MDSAAVFDDDGKNCGNGGICGNSNRVRGVCPKGWHLPSKEEFDTLFTIVGRAVAGKALKGSSGWRDGNNGSNDYGFSARPAGYRDGDDGNRNIFSDAFFWSATKNGSGYPYVMDVTFNDDYVWVFNSQNLGSGYSVRCIRD